MKRTANRWKLCCGTSSRADILRPRRRIYQTQNIYALLEKQAQLENEVKAIAQGNKQKAHRKRKAAD